MRNVLVVAVHPDDETLGCGGTLFKHARAGDTLHWLIATCMTQTGGFSGSQIGQRDRQIASVTKFYGFKSVHSLGIPTMTVDTVPMSDLVSRVASVLKKVRPDIIYLPFINDVHSDHRAIFSAAISCLKSFRYPSVKKVLMMETQSETDFSPAIQATSFVPNCFVDISAFLNKKVSAMRLYSSELGKHPFPRSVKGIRALAALRGASINREYAEAFMLLKEIA